MASAASGSLLPVREFADASAMAGPLGEFVAKAASQAISARGRFVVAVSGGSLPKNLAAALVDADGIDASKWVVAYADERFVALDSDDSNHKETEQRLTGPGKPLHGAETVPIDADAPTTADCAASYAAKLRAATGAKSDELPILDLVLLGMGPDGHTASLFPGHALLAETRAAVAAIEDSPKPPPKRVTLTLPTINAARAVAFVCTGAGKAGALAQVRSSAEGTSDSLPSARVQGAVWFVDTPAVRGE